MGRALVESCPKSLLSWPTAAVAAAAAATIPTSCSTAATAAIFAILTVPFYALTDNSVVLVYCSCYLVTAVLINYYWLTATNCSVSKCSTTKYSVLFYLPYFTTLTVCFYCYYCFFYYYYCYYYYCCYCYYFLFTVVLNTTNRNIKS